MASPQVDLSLTPESFKPVRQKMVARGKGPRREQPLPGIAAAAVPERYALLEAALDQAVGDHIITPLPTREPTSGEAYSCSRVKTIRNRIYLLGYLEEDNGQEILGTALKQGIRAFQQEASLADKGFGVDEWVGDQTWTALQELVSFEEPSNLQRWFVDSMPCAALQRAIQLRLFAFGLIDRKPHVTPDEQAIRSGLQIFAGLSGLLGCGDRPLNGEPCFETVSLLFDQDELVRRLAQVGPPHDAAELETTHAFILNISKAELWMLGYDGVAPKGYTEADIHPHSHDRRFELQRGPLHDALVQFWKDRDSRGPETRAVRHLTHYFPGFFSEIDTGMQGAAAAEPDSEKVFETLEEMSRNDKSQLQKVWDRIHAFGSQLWDGIRRAWHWLVAMVKKLVRETESFLRNISRLAYHYILKSFEAVKAVVEGIADSLSFFSSPLLPLPKRGLGIAAADGTQIGRDLDFDFIAVVDRDTAPADTERVAAYLESKSSLFTLSCQFLAELLGIVLDMFKGIFSGWVLLLMALLKLYKSIRQWAPAFIRARLQERDILVRQAETAA